MVFYSKVSLAVVMAVAVLLNLLIGLTAITDSMGFFIFLGLAAAFLT